ncbi:MAG: hypothetical protein IT488_02385 [Gammaproteobacteria bacterium]|nr:hypothetical protein [Gammaproteobacteria bacterium]
MGLWDSVFGKKVTIQGRDENGKPFETKVSEKQFKKWEQEGLLSKTAVVEVQVLDPKGSYTTHWKIGEDIPAEVVEKFKNPDTNKLYALTVYEAGEPKTSVLQHAKWLEIKAAMGE